MNDLKKKFKFSLYSDVLCFSDYQPWSSNDYQSISSVLSFQIPHKITFVLERVRISHQIPGKCIYVHARTPRQTNPAFILMPNYSVLNCYTNDLFTEARVGCQAAMPTV